MIKKLRLWGLLCLVGLPFLTGCWDRIEIEERGTILGLAIDPLAGEKVINVTGANAKSDTGGYKLTAQVAIPGRIPLGPATGGGERAEKPVWVISMTGKTIDDAMNNLQQELANKIFLGHLRVIIVNQKIAESPGLQDIQDFFRRNAEIRRLAWLLISTGSAKDAMEAVPKLERVPTLYLVGTMDQSVKMGKMPNVFLGNYWSIYSSQGRDPVLPLISVVSKDRIKLNGLAVFKGERMVGTLDPIGVATYMQLTGEQRAGYSMASSMPDDPEHSVINRSFSRKTKIIMRKDKSGKPSFEVYSRIEVNVEEATGYQKLADRQVIQQVAEESRNIITKEQEKTIQKLKRLHSDVIGFGELVRGQYPEYWSKIRTRDQWEQEFPNIPIRLYVQVEIRRLGMSAR